MNRRSFLQSCLALAAAPAIVRADSLMRIVPRDLTLLMPWQQEIASLIGCTRAVFANDLLTDTMLMRLDTLQGGTQYHVTVRMGETIPNDWREKYAAPALEILEAHLQKNSGTLKGCVAPPAAEWAFRNEIV